MKRNKIMASVLVSIILVTSFVFSVSAINMTYGETDATLYPALSLSFVKDNIDSLIDIDYLTQIAQRRNISFNPHTYELKQLVDFNGYTYYLIEFSPVGYAIYDNRFTHVLEFNARAISPYSKYSRDIFYAGAGEYYVKSDDGLSNTYVHPILNTTIIFDSETELFYRNKSDIVSTAVENKALSTLSSNLNNSVQLNATSSSQYASLTDYSSIVNCNTTGFNSSGNCGYIAASLIVWYHYDVLGWTDFVPGGVYNQALVDGIQGNRTNATYGPELQEAMSEWSYNHGAVEENGWQETLPGIIDVLPTASKIFNLINDDRPVALLGLTPPRSELDPSGTNALNLVPTSRSSVEHVITITGVDKITHSLINVDYFYYAHFGWSTSYNDIYISDSSLTKGAIVYY